MTLPQTPICGFFVYVVNRNMYVVYNRECICIYLFIEIKLYTGCILYVYFFVEYTKKLTAKIDYLNELLIIIK